MKYNQFFKTSSRIFVATLCVFSAYHGSAIADQMVAEATVQEIEPAVNVETKEVRGLTEESIKEFYAQSVTVQLEGVEATLAFLEKHTHDMASTKIHMRTLMQNKPVEKKIIITDKSTLLTDTKSAYEKGSIDKVENEVISVEISEDGLSAFVVDKTMLDFTLLASDTEKFLISSKQSCDTSIVLNDGIIQTKDSECDVEANVKPIE